MTLQVSLEDAYRTACAALGELVVRERLLSQRVAELTAATPVPASATTADKEPTP